MAYSGEGNLIEGQIEGDPNKTVVPVAVDSDGHLIIDLDASSITIGTVNQGVPNTPANAWPVKLVDAGGVNEAAVNGAGQVSVNVGNFPATQVVTGPLTDAQLRATPVPVSGTVTTTFSGTQNVNIVSTIPVPVTDNGGSLTIDGTVSVSGSITVTGPLTDTQLRASPVPVSGTITTSPNVNVHDGAGVSISSTGSSLNVDVTNTVPTTITGNVTVVQLTGTNLHTTVDNFPATQPISGTVTATQSGEWDVNIEDTAGNALTSTTGALDINIKSGSIANTGFTVTNAGGASAVNIQDGGNSITVDGTFFQATQPINGTVTSNQGTPASTANRWPVQITDGTDLAQVSAAGALLVDGSAVTQPVSGTVSISFPTGTLNNGAETAVAGTAVSILSANANRNKLIIQNTGAANVRIGTTGVTATTGFRLTVGATIIMDNPECPINEIFAIREGAISSTILAQEVV